MDAMAASKLTGNTASLVTNVAAGRIAATNVQTAIDEIDDEKPQMIRRQGGSATNWSAGPASSNYTVTDAVIQCGAVTIAGSYGSATITFPTAFTQAPIVIAQWLGYSVYIDEPPNVQTTSTTQAVIYNTIGTTYHASLTCMWIAIGK